MRVTAYVCVCFDVPDDVCAENKSAAYVATAIEKSINDEVSIANEFFGDNCYASLVGLVINHDGK